MYQDVIVNIFLIFDGFYGINIFIVCILECSHLLFTLERYGLYPGDSSPSLNLYQSLTKEPDSICCIICKGENALIMVNDVVPER